jgi:LAO/AO transport system kinase
MISDFVQRVLAGEFRAVARLITIVENALPEAAEYLRELFPHSGRSFTVGITGAPGSGKSTLVDALAAHYRSVGRRVGIIAVDPTSPFTGGAILGDRIRMQSRSLDEGTFIRSMATRGHLGGLARTTGDVLTVLDAAGFDVVLIETVGVGQDEVEIVRTAQATVVLLVPGMGDDIQTMKAGIMEIGDIFVINKADHPGADRVEAELKALLSMCARRDSWMPEVVRTIASEGQGIENCVQAIEKYRSHLEGSELKKSRSIQIQRDRLLELVRAQIMQRVMDAPGIRDRIDEMAELIADRRLDPFTAAEQLLNLQCLSERQTGDRIGQKN